MEETRKKYVDVHVEATVGGFLSKRGVRLTLAGIPATPGASEDGQPMATPTPDPRAKDHVMSQLGRPILEIVGKFKESDDLKKPNVRLEFRPTLSPELQQRGASSTDELPEAQLDAIRYPIEDPRWTLDDVVLPPSTRNQLEVVLTLVRNHSLMYDTWNLKKIVRSTASVVSLNFYGPSGTGKTLCAEAVASYLRKQILRVNYSELEQVRRRNEQEYPQGISAGC